jgi:hypothetical protein
LLDLPLKRRLDHGHGLWKARESQGPRFVRHIDAGAAELLHPGHGLEQGLLPAAVGAVGLGDHTGRRALEHQQLPNQWRDLRDELDGAGPRADHRDALAAQVHRVVPVRRVELASLELVQPVDARHQGRAGLGSNEKEYRCEGTSQAAHIG